MPKKSTKKTKTKTKKLPPVKEMFGVCIDSVYDSYVTREATEDQYDGDDISYSNTINGIRPAPADYRGDLIVDFPIEQARAYYLVSVTHTDGDSFHHEDGLVAYIDLFKTKQEAQALADAVQKKYDIGRTSDFYSDTNLMYNGKNYYTYQWSGYFNRLQSIEVTQVLVLDK